MRYLLLPLILAGCAADETISGFADPQAIYALEGLDGATIQFPEQGRVAGQGPCNRYFANQTAPYPWIKIGPIGATKMACPDLEQEQAFFQALEQSTLAEVSGPTLILTTDSGEELVFRAASARE